MRPVAAKYPLTQGFASMPTAGVAPSTTPNTVGWYVRMYGNYQPFGHAGADIGCPTGTPVYAMRPGRVVWADWGTNLPGDDSWGSLGYFRRWAFYKSFPGILTVIHHPQIGPHVYTAYAHLSDNNQAPHGTQVKEGQLIGYSGATGGVAPHLHVELLVDPNYSTGGGLIYGRTDPAKYFDTGAAAIAPQSTTTRKGLFMYLSKDQEQEVLAAARLVNKYLDMKTSDVKHQVWGYKNLEKTDAWQILRDIRDALKGGK